MVGVSQSWSLTFEGPVKRELYHNRRATARNPSHNVTAVFSTGFVFRSVLFCTGFESCRFARVQLHTHIRTIRKTKVEVDYGGHVLPGAVFFCSRAFHLVRSGRPMLS